VSRGHLSHDGETVSFVALPTFHSGHRIAWLAFGRGAQPTKWALLRSWLQDDNVAAGVVDFASSSLRGLEPFASGSASVLSRADVLGDPSQKAWLFELHDALLQRHDDLQQLFYPERGRDFSFGMPDCVHALPPAQRSARNQQNFAECGDRLFVRALFPLPVSDGGELRVGVWIELPPEAFFGLMEAWDDEAQYMAQRLQGPIENAITIAGQQLRGTTVKLAPRTADQCLFVSGSDAPAVARMLREGVSVAGLPALVREIRASVKS
jgi:hypothetical protein